MGKGVRRRRGARQQARLEIAPGLGGRLHAARERAGLSQTQAGAPRYPSSYISALEHGRHLPSIEALTLIATNLGLSVGELLTGEAEPADPATAIARALQSVRAARPTSRGESADALTAVEFILKQALPVLAGRPE